MTISVVLADANILCQEHGVVPPRNLSNRLLDNCLLGPRLGERAHVHEVGAGEASEVGKDLVQVMGQSIDNLAAPPLLNLTVEDVPADLHPATIPGISSRAPTAGPRDSG